MAHPDEAAAEAAVHYLKAMGHPDAALAQKALDELRDGKREGLKIRVGVRATLEKFDGEKRPGQKPVETVVMEG